MNYSIHKFTEPRVNLDGESILVTGGTGSFGKAFIKFVLENYKPRRLIVFSRDEFKQYEMEKIYPNSKYECIRYFIGDVRDVDRLKMAMRGINIVIHAAALKHVPACEYNPFECIHTNVLGAENIVKSAISCGVQKVIALSTDKATNPINLYGASKLSADKIFMAANSLAGIGQGTKFSVVRYGNVLGSRGSVIPFFYELIKNGADSLPITDSEMTRFWITIEQGVCFVLSCLDMILGGELFSPKIPSMKVIDVANALAPDLPHHIVGIRPGEKLHEVMISNEDARNTLELPDRFIIQPNYPYWDKGDYLKIGAKQVDDKFYYSSNNNKEWLDREGLLSLLK